MSEARSDYGIEDVDDFEQMSQMKGNQKDDIDEDED